MRDGGMGNNTDRLVSYTRARQEMRKLVRVQYIYS
jgi:hypothetical protein